MRTQMTRAFPETALERLLEALERELVEASDEEILEAAADLGMQPGMKGSAAFLGLRFSAAPRAEDFFDDPQWLLRVLSDPRRIRLVSATLPPAPQTPSRPRTAGRKSLRPPKEPGES